MKKAADTRARVPGVGQCGVVVGSSPLAFPVGAWIPGLLENVVLTISVWVDALREQ